MTSPVILGHGTKQVMTTGKYTMQKLLNFQEKDNVCN
jgi:hypothetical protein